MDEGFTASDIDDTVWLAELRQYGAVDGPRQQPINPISETQQFGVTPSPSSKAERSKDHFLSSRQVDQTSPSLEVHHASPLAPLRKRDSQALDTFFDSDRIQEVALDIHRYLARMYPEPCWEDEPYEFLKGYI